MRLLLSKHRLGRPRKSIMNLEQRNRIFLSINKLEGLLAYAIKIGDKVEEERIRAELVQLVSQVE